MRQNPGFVTSAHRQRQTWNIAHLFWMIDMRKYELEKNANTTLYIRRNPVQLYIDLVRPVHPLQYVHVCKRKLAWHDRYGISMIFTSADILLYICSICWKATRRHNYKPTQWLRNMNWIFFLTIILFSGLPVRLCRVMTTSCPRFSVN